MVGRQVEKLKASTAESLGVHADDLVLAYTGPDFRLWLVVAAVFGGVLFGIVGLGGAVGGGLVGAAVGAWFLTAKPYVVAVDGESTYLVRISQPLWSSAKPEEILRRDPADAALVWRDGGKLHYGEMEMQVLLLWRGRADAVIAAAAARTGPAPPETPAPPALG